MNKKIYIIVSLLLLTMTISFTEPVFAKEVNLIINGQEVKPDVPPTILNGRTLVPIRIISETLGAQVDWDSTTKTVNISYYNDKIVLKIDDKNAYINDTIVELDVTAKTIKGRTMVPIRFISEALGAEVGWVQETSTVIVNKESTKITDVLFEETSEGYQLQIKGTAPLKYDIKTLSDPERLIIDIYDSVVYTDSDLISVNKIGINQIRIGQFQVNPNIARIVLDLENKVQFEAKSLQDSEIIAVTFMSSVEGVKYGVSDSQKIVSITTEGKVNYNVFELTGPERLVVDIEGVILNTDEEIIEIDGDDLVKRIRTAQFQMNPHIVRVVVDLNKKVGGYNVLYEDKEIRLVLNSSSLAGRRIIIDPGHGGDDPGATSITGVHEKVLTLDTSKRLKALLERAGAEVYMTRESDTSIKGPVRVEVANKINGDALISIHYNSYTNPEINGTEVLYCPDTTGKNKKLARLVQQELVKHLGSRDRGLRERPDLVLLRETSMPSVMVEVGYISNKDEEKKILNPEYRQQAAQAICNALVKYFSGD
ncbi:MAG TPA: AMIN domain-containing protein [Thermoanaerobacterales bacterium]|nr:AMIN domain-containing protein [Thermoanaerobacterales bacterium]